MEVQAVVVMVLRQEISDIYGCIGLECKLNRGGILEKG